MVLDPESARVPVAHANPPGPGVGASPYALQILTTEHWSLLAARNLVYTEAMSRAAIFVAALSGSVVALALVAQATDFGNGFVAFALVLLPVVYLLGVVTVVRLSQVNWEDARWVQGMNRIRHAYVELAPELEPYFVTSTHDDPPGVLHTTLATNRPVSWFQPFVAVPGVVAVMDSVVAGATAGIGAHALALGTTGSLAIGALFLLLSVGGFGAWARYAIARGHDELVPLFPTAATDAAET